MGETEQKNNLSFYSDFIDKAMKSTIWDEGNNVLYDLCNNKPEHIDPKVITAKIWLIGRTYAAAIERTKNSDLPKGDNFYTEKVIPLIQNSDIDKCFKLLKTYNEINDENKKTIMEIHKKVTNLFYDISKLNKRSLASKYLHFHFPHLYFIYDSRVVKAFRCFKTQKNSNINVDTDEKYMLFFEKCLQIRRCIEYKFKKKLTPRQLDNLFLDLDTKTCEKDYFDCRSTIKLG